MPKPQDASAPIDPASPPEQPPALGLAPTGGEPPPPEQSPLPEQSPPPSPKQNLPPEQSPPPAAPKTATGEALYVVTLGTIVTGEGAFGPGETLPLPVEVGAALTAAGVVKPA